ncbi:hypothetical protein F9883_00825 [Morganella morganii]|uniref:colicin E5-related ribonuclease n=1 Tax=Morganella morganii TaxID=582 RepID=UPI0015F5E134|nr:colicin E5-related ribonuclease [Morganella morganii]MBA5806429.1 hypothetical protein [Morganella morganii]
MMSGGDGNGYNSGAHDTGGNINGGPTGIGGNGGSTSGGTGSGSGWGTTQLPDGRNIHHYDPDKFGGHRDNNSGNNSYTDLNNTPESLNYIDIPRAPKTVYVSADTIGLAFSSALSAYYASLNEAQLAALKAFLTTSAVIAGRVLGILGLFYPSQIAPDPKVTIYVKDFDIDNPYNAVMLPAGVVTSVPPEDIPEKTSVPASVIAQAVIDELTETRPVAITAVNPTQVPIVKAQKTNKPNVYTAQVVPGMKPIRISVNDTGPVKPNTVPRGLNTTPEIKQYLPAPEKKENVSHHAIIDFGGDHAPVYISVTKQVKPEDAKKQAEQAKKDRAALYPAEVAQEQLDVANNDLAKADADLKTAQKNYDAVKNTDVSKLKNELTKAQKGFAYFEARNATNEAGAYKAQMGYIEDTIQKYTQAKDALAIAVENRKNTEDRKKAAEDKIKEEKDKKGKTPELKFDEKIKDQMNGRGWTEQDVKDTVAKGPKGKSFDKRSPKKTPPDHLGRNDTATIYGKQGEYIVVNDRTGEVVQVSDKTDPQWIDDSRIQWEGK